jgi:hypothetical protein
MNIMLDVGSTVGPSARKHTSAREEYVCWSRMQAEGGQMLDAILARKELERHAGDGCFMWGVGNPPALLTRSLSRAGVPVRVIFSIMKTKPKAIDVAPGRTVAWRCFIDAQGIERPLPHFALVTSRGDSASGAKRSHYALMCRSDEPLALTHDEPFDPGAFRNAGGTGAQVGASQVTALLRRVDDSSRSAGYAANMKAWLTGSYWVRLTDPVELDGARILHLATADQGGVRQWCDAVAAIRGGPSTAGARETGSLL